MSEATRILREEHDNILCGLEALEACAAKLQAQQPVPPETLEGFIEFFRLYADRTHHGKEEELLFPAMIANGFSREVGPIHCMLSDHEHNRALTREMIDAAARYRNADKKAGLDFASAATQYVSALREHIQKENLVLFVMADNAIPQKDQPELLTRFREVDDQKIGGAEIARLLKLRDSLSQQFLVAAQ
jgi:hemerythrin-like domain-containing protein